MWQWTASEFVDAHTRRVVVRGGSSYVPLTGGEWTKWSWYFQPAARLDTHNTYLLQRGLHGYNRAKTVGFRCLKDAPNEDTK